MNTFYREQNSSLFFDLLPFDWCVEISGIWDSNSKDASIYLLESHDDIVAGGIVFSICPPDMLYNQQEAAKWLGTGYHYIGFLWVVEEFRNNRFGTIWIESLFNKYPHQKFWLTIEEEALLDFYIKNGFQFVKTLQNGENTEWLLIYEPS